MDYYDLRKVVSKIVPRQTVLKLSNRHVDAVREKGRKHNYSQYNLKHGEWRKQERLLKTDQINSFLEISLRAAACPLCLNCDVVDSLSCGFSCVYCYANAFRASLYTAFFDNSKEIGYRFCNPTYYKQEMDKMARLRALPFEEKKSLSGVSKAFALEIPIRFGIRFEDFLPVERREGVSLELLRYLSNIVYPVMINSKSSLLGTEPYVRALADNRAGAAVHITLISSNDDVLKRLEPGAPNYQRRLTAIRNLSSAGVRVVARIEPYLFLVNDRKEDVQRYMEDIWEAGVRHLTFDTYSYTAQNPGIRQSFINVGYDFDRIFLAGCDSQPFGSLLLGKFMELFRRRGFSCSSFDMGNVPSNDDAVCCEVGDMFPGFNYGCTVVAARFIKKRGRKHTSWTVFERYVEKHGGFLTEALRMEVKALWNLGGNDAYSPRWAAGLTPVGRDEDGIIWIHEESADLRTEILENLI